MAQMIRVKPSRPGLKVPDERGRQIMEGEVKRTPWIIRRIKEGDLIDVDAEAKAKEKYESTSKPKSKKEGDK